MASESIYGYFKKYSFQSIMLLLALKSCPRDKLVLCTYCVTFVLKNTISVYVLHCKLLFYAPHDDLIVVCLTFT